MRKDTFAQALFIIIGISGLVLALSAFISPLNFLIPFLVPVFVVCSLLLPWAKKANVWISSAGILGIIFYFAGYFIPMLSFLMLISIFMAVIIVVANAFIKEDSPEDEDLDDLPLPGPSYKQGKIKSNLIYFVSMCAALFNPFQLIQMVYQLIGMITPMLMGKKIYSSAGNFRQQTEYCLPVSGEWFIINGGTNKKDSHSWEIFNQRYAYDMVITDSNKARHEKGGNSVEDYFCYGEPIFAPADGEVVHAKTSVRDSKHPGTMRIDFLAKDFRGNFVMIKHAPNEYSFMAHFIPESILVKKGENVCQGQVIGKCGNSGHSTEPHLHFHVQDHPNFYLGIGLPVKFSHLVIDGNFYEKAYIKKGQVVRSSGDNKD